VHVLKANTVKPRKTLRDPEKKVRAGTRQPELYHFLGRARLPPSRCVEPGFGSARASPSPNHETLFSPQINAACNVGEAQRRYASKITCFRQPDWLNALRN
jgi:hypothetical protein